MNEFSHFTDYDNSPIIDNYLYFVKKINPSLSYPMYPFSLCFGCNIKNNVLNIEILVKLLKIFMMIKTGRENEKRLNKSHNR